jgi:cell division protein FtsN
MNEQKIKNSSDKIGPLVGSIIIILIITLGAFYLFSIIKDKVEIQNENTDEMTEENVSNNSDEVSNIEAELNSMGVENYDEDMTAIEAEFQN